MKGLYEYRLVVKCLDPVRPVASANIDNLDLVEATLQKALRTLVTKEISGQDRWEINSHSIAFCDNIPVISVIFQRQQT